MEARISIDQLGATRVIQVKHDKSRKKKKKKDKEEEYFTKYYGSRINWLW